MDMSTGILRPDLDNVFWTIVTGEAQWVRAEFDEIINAGWDTAAPPPPPAPLRPDGQPPRSPWPAATPRWVVNHVGFIDSSGLHTLGHCRHHADDLGKTFRVTGHHGHVATVIEVTGLTGCLTDPNRHGPKRR